MSTHIPTLRAAIHDAERVGVRVERVNRTGELRASLDGEPTVRINNRRKDAPRALLKLIQKAESQ